MHTVVVGGGIIGVATAHALAGRDGSVTLLEARRFGNAEGSSHGPSRILRLTYQATDYIDLLRLAYPAWDALGEEAGERLRIPCGGLDFGPPGAQHVAEMRTAMRAGGVLYEDVDADAIRAAYPQLNVADDTDGYLQPDYSLLAADRCLAALVEGARARGATVREGVKSTAVAVDGDGVSVSIADGTVVRADRVVLAAGSWLGPLAAQLSLALPLTVLKEQLAFFEPADASRFEPGRFPLFITRVPGSSSLGSGFPILGEPWGVKCMVDRIGPSVAPDDPDRTIAEATLADLDVLGDGDDQRPHRPCDSRVELPLHDDAGRGFHPRPAPRVPAGRRRLVLLRARVQVRSDARRDRGRPRDDRGKLATDRPLPARPGHVGGELVGNLVVSTTCSTSSSRGVACDGKSHPHPAGPSAAGGCQDGVRRARPPGRAHRRDPD